MSIPRRWRLFEAIGVEIEYMIVDARSLDVRPVADELFRSITGDWAGDVERGSITWSNELVAHVVELKTSDPATSLVPLPGWFQQNVRDINARLGALGCRLLPGGAHPWMNPLHETRLWPHENWEFYETFDRIFDCRRHGWANLQSVHLNLPFDGEDEFARLHAAIRLLLPILPALAASSPVLDGRVMGFMDSRLDAYRDNARRVPSISGRVIPEPVFTAADYDREILQRIYRDIAPFDSAGLLQEEWLNARGAIARFTRGTIEIRVLDVQECPMADVAIASVIVSLLKELVSERWRSISAQQAWSVDRLERIMLKTVRDAESAVLDDSDYLAAFGYTSASRATAGELWSWLVERHGPAEGPLRTALSTITQHGTLARRITRSLNAEPSPERLGEVYRRLADCLEAGELFVPSWHVVPEPRG